MDFYTEYFKGKNDKIYNVFISHSWTYNDSEYEKIVEWLDDSDIAWKDYSVPQNDPIHTNGSDKELYEAIKNKISPSTIILMMGNVASSYSKWIDKEIEISKEVFDKKILGINSNGTHTTDKQTSKKVADAADKIVGWTSKSIIDAIKELCEEE
ncbi:hypothetical protein RyT2_06280 [Pseudolactococcus yaeyamensis]